MANTEYLAKAIATIQFLADESQIDQDNARGMISYICTVITEKMAKSANK